MSLSFNEMKKNRQSNLDSLKKEITKLQSGSGSDEDARFWQPTVDKAGNGMATIRFLPTVAGEDLPYARVFSHGFKGPTGLWYIENSLTTIGKTDPVSEYNSQLWNSTSDDASPARKQVRDQKRKLNFISNILVIKDSANPQNEGKVFLYRYGKKIFDKINEAMNPQYDDETPINPFDFWEGANFKLKIRQVEGYRNYDKSEFESPAPLSDDDERLETIWKSQYALAEFTDPATFKTYDELKAKLSRVLGLDSNGSQTPAAARKTAEQKSDTWDDDDDVMPAPRQKSAESNRLPIASDDDDDLDFFKNLANDD